MFSIRIENYIDEEDGPDDDGDDADCRNQHAASPAQRNQSAILIAEKITAVRVVFDFIVHFGSGRRQHQDKDDQRGPPFQTQRSTKHF